MLDFHQIDVFTDQFLFGNPVAVVHDADLLTSTQMSAIAKWTNLSETVFLLQPSTRAADYRLRIFTPVDEMPFAGHPTLGAARAWLERGGKPSAANVLTQECGIGLVTVRHTGNRMAFAAPPLIRDAALPEPAIAQLAAALRIQPTAIRGARWADNGSGWIAVLLDDAQTVLGLERPTAPVQQWTKIGVVGPYPPGSETNFEVRAFTPTKGGGEDPVTGSLNAAIAQWLIPSSHAPRSFTVSQGTRMGRRGRIHVNAEDRTIWVGGDTVVGVAGYLTEPT